jgi:hypothetical protein
MYIEDTTPEEKRKKAKEDRIRPFSNMKAAWHGTMRSNMASSFGDCLQQQMQSLPCPAAYVGRLACNIDNLYVYGKEQFSSRFNRVQNNEVVMRSGVLKVICMSTFFRAGIHLATLFHAVNYDFVYYISVSLPSHMGSCEKPAQGNHRRNS